MNRSLVVGLLSATMLVSAAAPSLSERLASNPLQDGQRVVRVMANDVRAGDERVHLAQANFDRPGHDARPKHSRHGERADRRDRDHDNERRTERAGPRRSGHETHQPGLRLAASLAAAETYVGITSAQLDSWRAYTTALIDLLDRPERENGPDRQRGEIPAGPPPTVDGTPSEQADVPLFAERLADIAIERGERAEALKVAISALRGDLEPDQIGRLRDAERSLLPSPEPRGPERPDQRRGDPREHLRGETPPPRPSPQAE